MQLVIYWHAIYGMMVEKVTFGVDIWVSVAVYGELMLGQKQLSSSNLWITCLNIDPVAYAEGLLGIVLLL